jgi:hypothetical protein
MSWRCRVGWHSMRRVGVDGNMLSSDRHTRHSWTITHRCWRCPHEEIVEHFDSRGYWRDFEREQEDTRLEDIIRRATR